MITNQTILALYRKLSEAPAEWFDLRSSRHTLAKCYRCARKIDRAESRVLRNLLTVARVMP